jgi:hypothetical protein
MITYQILADVMVSGASRMSVTWSAARVGSERCRNERTDAAFTCYAAYVSHYRGYNINAMLKETSVLVALGFRWMGFWIYAGYNQQPRDEKTTSCWELQRVDHTVTWRRSKCGWRRRFVCRLNLHCVYKPV